MRKIEQQMCQAIQANKNWSNANTSVIFDSETNNSNVYLHGNLIATVTDTDMTIYDGGHQTVTTKSRLNALCDYFCIAGEGVFQKNFQWYVRKLVAESSITGKVFNVEEFNGEFTFAWIINLMFQSLSKQRSSNELLSIHMKFLLCVIIGVLLWNSTDARQFTSNVLEGAADFIEPDNSKEQTIGERIDSFLQWLNPTILQQLKGAFLTEMTPFFMGYIRITLKNL